MLALGALIQDLDNLLAQDTSENTPYKDLESNYNTFYSLIETELNRGKSQYRSTKKPWWNVELELLQKDLRKSQNAWANSTTPLEKNRLWQIYKNRQNNLTSAYDGKNVHFRNRNKIIS